jgi:hypothetical protein
MKKLLIYFLVALIPFIASSQPIAPDSERCSLEKKVYDNCWSVIDYLNGQKYVGMLASGKPHGEGILYFSDGVVREQGRWKEGELFVNFPVNKDRFPFDDSLAAKTARAIEAERERNRPPEQKIAFCVQTVRVETRGTTFPSISVPYCQDACNKTYSDRMCSEVGGSKWRVQATSPKTAPPNSSYFAGMGTCSCVGQEYVLNEIKETPPPVALPVPASTVQADLREAELAKREKALADREKALLEAENKRLREELEAERKKKK